MPVALKNALLELFVRVGVCLVRIEGLFMHILRPQHNC